MVEYPYMNRAWLIVFGDFISFLISFILLILIRFNENAYTGAINSHIVPFIILSILWIIIFYVFGLYDLVTIKPTIPYLKRWILALISSFIVGLFLFYFVSIFKISPKINLFIQIVFFGFFSFLFRRVIYTLFAKAITRPVILVGDSQYLSELKKTIATNPQVGLRIINHFQNINDLDLDINHIKDYLIILDKKKETSDEQVLNLYRQGVDIIDTAKAYEKYLFKIPVEYIDMSFIVENIEIKKDIIYKSATYILNTILSLFILIITSPLLLISIIFIYLNDRGPIFYTQERIGLNGKVFKLYKLRSMTINAERDGAVWCKGSDDTRITPIGRIIRKLHIDEIPQMLNIIKGELSFVGPRPERPEFVTPLENAIPHYKLRHIIRPGFTGWAQIKYHYANTEKDSKEKFEYDLYYIKNRNFFLDFGIILRTILIIFNL